MNRLQEHQAKMRQEMAKRKIGNQEDYDYIQRQYQIEAVLAKTANGKKQSETAKIRNICSENECYCEKNCECKDGYWKCHSHD